MTRPVRPVALVILTACMIYPGVTLLWQGLYPFVAGTYFNLVGETGPWMWLALKLGVTPWVWPVASGLGVAGHCWPAYARFRGGMGMAVGGGMLLVLWPLGFAIGIGVAVACQLTIHHSARANFATGLLAGPLSLLFAWIFLRVNPAGYSPAAILGSDWSSVWASLPLAATVAAAGLVISIRSLSDWKRVYKELWLDRGH